MMNMMKFSYYNIDDDKFNCYNLDDDWFEKKQPGWVKKKIFSIIFPNSNILESVQFENSDRGYLLWITTPKTVRVFGFWSNDSKAACCKKFYQKWNNDQCGCC